MKKYNIEKELAKMTKETIKVEVCDFLTIFSGGTIKEAIACLQSYDNGKRYLEVEYDSYGDNLLIVCEDRLESDKEFEERKKQYEQCMIAHNKNIDEAEEKERALYEKLEKKYGKSRTP